MTNPFENANGNYLALVNEESQDSLWPAYLKVSALSLVRARANTTS